MCNKLLELLDIQTLRNLIVAASMQDDIGASSNLLQDAATMLLWAGAEMHTDNIGRMGKFNGERWIIIGEDDNAFQLYHPKSLQRVWQLKPLVKVKL